MSDTFQIQINLDSFNAKMGAMAAAAGSAAARRALTSGAMIILNDAKRDAPWKSGTLKRSLHIEPDPDHRGGVAVLIGTNVPYAARLEFGFVGADSLGRIYNQAARPYLRPAMDNNREAVVQEVGRALVILLEAA